MAKWLGALVLLAAGFAIGYFVPRGAANPGSASGNAASPVPRAANTGPIFSAQCPGHPQSDDCDLPDAVVHPTAHETPRGNLPPNITDSADGSSDGDVDYVPAADSARAHGSRTAAQAHYDFCSKYGNLGDAVFCLRLRRYDEITHKVLVTETITIDATNHLGHFHRDRPAPTLTPSPAAQ